MATRTRRSASPAPEAPTTEAAPEAAPSAEAGTDLSGLTQEDLVAKVAELQAALAAKPIRKAREVRPTPKQVKFLEALRETPDATVGSLCTSAGATETSHGFVFRMIEHGFLTLAVSPEAAKFLPPVPEADGTESAESEK